MFQMEGGLQKRIGLFVEFRYAIKNSLFSMKPDDGLLTGISVHVLFSSGQDYSYYFHFFNAV